MSWSEVEFQKLYAEPSRNGVYKKKEHHGSGVKIVNMGELFAFDFINGQPMKRLQLTGPEIARSGLREGDLLFGRRSLVESGAGKCSVVEELSEPTTFESSIIRVRVDPSKARPKFLYYWFKSPIGRGRVRAIVTGVNVKGIRGTVLQKIDVTRPPIATQDRIVEILSSYDDLIENNRRRIELLEQSARLLYKEWFVHLRFPGHEHVTITNGIPDGWEEGEVQDFYRTASGGTPSRKKPQYYTGEIPWVKTKELPNGFILDTEEHITEEGLKSSSAKLFPADTLLLALYGATIGELGILTSEAATNQACCAVMPKDERCHIVHSYLFFRENKKNLVSLSGGAAQNNISQVIVRNFPMVMPAKTVMRLFVEKLEPVFASWRNLERQNVKLEHARDLLLPRLMNGEIAV